MALLPTSAQDLIQRQFFSPTADTKSPLIQALTGSIQQGRADAATRDQNQLFATGAQAAFQGNISPQQQAQLFTANPERATALLATAGASTAAGREKLGRTAFRIQGLQDPNQQIAAIDNVIQQIQAGNGDASAWISMRENPGSINQSLSAMTGAATSLSDQITGKQKDREFGLKEDKLGLDTKLTAAKISDLRSQSQARGVKAAQVANQLAFDKQTLEVRKLEKDQTAINNQIKQETNAIRRDQLQVTLDENKRIIDQKKRDVQFNADSALIGAQDIIDTTTRLLEGVGLEQAAGVSSIFPTAPGTKAADFEALLETLKSQAFLSGVDKLKGMGALGEKEGQKIQDAAGSLNLSMSDATLRREINRINKVMVRAKKRLEIKFNIGSKRKVTLENLTVGDLSTMSDEELKQLSEQ